MKKIIITSLIFVFGISVGFGVFSFYYAQTNNVVADDLRLDDQEATIRAIQKVIPSVVSIIVYDQQEYYSVDLSTGEQASRTEKVEEGRGTGFIISPDGFILTNKHVVNAGAEETAEYRIILNSGKQYYAQLIGKDPLNDLAILKIFDKDLPCIELGDSSNLSLGSTVMAIGNVLGRYQNSVTKGIVSGLGRELIASDNNGNTESFKNVIQTDAEINFGNSGGPLIDLNGKLIGINVAIDSAGSSIGFAIPINDARSVITSIKESGRIIRTRLGVRYFMLTPQIALEYDLPTDTGAWLSRGDRLDLPAVLLDSPAAKAGIEEGDIILEVNAAKIEGTNTLTSVIQNYKPGDKIGLKIRRGDKIIIREVTLDEFKE